VSSPLVKKLQFSPWRLWRNFFFILATCTIFAIVRILHKVDGENVENGDMFSPFSPLSEFISKLMANMAMTPPLSFNFWGYLIHQQIL
jgi:hypothetical protein